jgi:hypothetical protein
VPELLARVRPVHEVVPVEAYLPGCPPFRRSGSGRSSSASWPASRPHWRASSSGSAERRKTHGQANHHRPGDPDRGARQDQHLPGRRGLVSDAEFHVVEFRGFEKFCEGRPYSEMPGITARICGICPVSHLLASAKAGDAIMAVAIPPPPTSCAA